MNREAAERRRVLIVDDNRKVLDLLNDLLIEEGYDVIIAEDGQSALEIARSQNLDLVISDVVMPVMDGIQLCRLIKQDIRTTALPVLLLSGIRESSEHSVEGLTAGADDYLDIPFRNERLLIKVAQLTERHRVERRYREIVEEAVDIIYTRSMDGYITSINRAGARFFGRPAAELVGLHLSELIGVEAATQDIEETKNVSSDSTLRSIHQLQDCKGSWRYLEGVVKVERDAQGHPVEVRGVVRDITEQKLAEEAVRESQAFFHSFMDNSPAVAFMKDDEGRYVYVNQPFERLFGQKLTFLRGRRSFDWLPEDTAQMTHAHDLEVLETGRSAKIVETIPGPDGSNHYWLVFKFPITDASGKKFVGGVGVDITEHRLAEEALAQQAEREALTNRISQAVRCSLDPAEIFRTAAEELGSHLNVDRCSLFMRDESGKRALNVAEYHAEEVRPAESDFDLSDLKGLIESLDNHGVLVFDDAAHDSRIADMYERILAKADVRSIMYVAIRVGDEVSAAFALSTTQALRQWTESDIALAKTVADQTGIAIRQAELYQKAETSSIREALVNRLTTAIRASLSLSEVLSTATRELGLALSASRVHLHLHDSEDSVAPVEHEYVAPGCDSVAHMEAGYADPIARHLQSLAKPIVINDSLNYSEKPPEFSAYIQAHARKVGVRSQIACPLMVKGRFRGVLCIHQTDRLRRWTEDEVTLVNAVAERLAVGIAQAELFEIVARAKMEWETTFDAMSDGIFIFDRSGELKRVNQAGATLENSHPWALLGRKCCDILRTNSKQQSCVVEKAIERGQSVTIEITPERLNRPLLVTIEPILDSGNRPIAVVCTARDLSELRKVEAVARENQSLLTNILESARESIYAVDSDGRFKWCNSATLAVLGYKREEFIGRHLLDVVYEGDHEVVTDKLRGALSGQPQTYEMRYFAPDGRLRYARVDNSPLVIEGRTTGVLGIARDVTERKEEQERAARADKLRALGQLASGVAHDFNNSLAAILGRAQILRRQTMDEGLLRNLEIIQTAAEDAAATVRRIQTFARKSPVKEFETLNIPALLHDAVEITRTRWENEAQSRGLDYAVTLEAEGEQHTYGVASELREVFVNLIVNAVDAMPGGGRLSISCLQQGSRLKLQFVDNGTGMPEDVRLKIFEPFFSTKGAHGTGLGLSVSHSIIERHGGSISVQSELRKGTVFTIDLPATDSESQPPEREKELVKTAALSILVIDDEPSVRETLADMLTTIGHKVVSAQGGQEALKKLTGGAFDIVFTDLAMPEMDGWETAREIRKQRGDELRIVLVTGYGPAAVSPQGEDDLVDGVIGKPFDFTQVIDTIAAVVGKQAILEEVTA